jgi:hypothetical protein
MPYHRPPDAQTALKAPLMGGGGGGGGGGAGGPFLSCFPAGACVVAFPGGGGGGRRPKKALLGRLVRPAACDTAYLTSLLKNRRG